MKFNSVKTYDGFSTCFRQWRAEQTHCKFLHGYGVSFKVWFEGDLDEKNWVFDFGGMKRVNTKINGMSPNDYFKWLLDHTTIVAEDDPYLEEFEKLARIGIIQLRTVEHTGCERFAELLLTKVNDFLTLETNGRVVASKLEFKEHDKNSAIAYRE